MVNQLLGVTSDSEVNEMAQLFSDFVDGCLSIPINLPGFAYHTAMTVNTHMYMCIYIYIYNFTVRISELLSVTSSI